MVDDGDLYQIPIIQTDRQTDRQGRKTDSQSVRLSVTQSGCLAGLLPGGFNIGKVNICVTVCPISRAYSCCKWPNYEVRLTLVMYP